MSHTILEFLRNLLVHYGYWAVAVTLLLENAGIPIPGETVLLLASFLCFSERNLDLPWLMMVATFAATLGDNIGYAVGLHGGRSLLERYQVFFRMRRSTLIRGERLFARYGPVTVFFARFIFGLRIIAGPLAGVLRMPWRRFLVCNFLGAALWVTLVSGAGYLFGQHWERLANALKRFDLGLLGIAVMIAVGIWWRGRLEGHRASGE